MEAYRVVRFKDHTTSRKIFIFLGRRVRPVRGADNLGIHNISQPYRLPRPVTGIALLLLFYGL
jgi:hypothetical protein